MLVICPYTTLSPETSAALSAAHAAFDCVYVGASDERYWELLAALWADGEDFALVEQDIVVQPDTLKSFTACPHAWCTAEYPYLRSEFYTGLGCVRFRSDLMERFPDMLERVGAMSNDKHAPKMWCTLDAWMQQQLRRRGVHECRKHGSVGHLHRNPSHGCIDAQYLYEDAA